jgi:hypothetical protein
VLSFSVPVTLSPAGAGEAFVPALLGRIRRRRPRWAGEGGGGGDGDVWVSVATVQLPAVAL